MFKGEDDPMGNQLCISADSHVVESAEFFEPLGKLFGDKAPRIVTVDPARGPQLDLGNGKLGLGLSGFFMQNVDFTTPEALEPFNMIWQPDDVNAKALETTQASRAAMGIAGSNILYPYEGTLKAGDLATIKAAGYDAIFALDRYRYWLEDWLDFHSRAQA